MTMYGTTAGLLFAKRNWETLYSPRWCANMLGCLSAMPFAGKMGRRW
jgi:hypothetical protein